LLMNWLAPSANAPICHVHASHVASANRIALGAIFSACDLTFGTNRRATRRRITPTGSTARTVCRSGVFGCEEGDEGRTRERNRQPEGFHLKLPHQIKL